MCERKQQGSYLRLGESSGCQASMTPSEEREIKSDEREPTLCGSKKNSVTWAESWSPDQPSEESQAPRSTSCLSFGATPVTFWDQSCQWTAEQESGLLIPKVLQRSTATLEASDNRDLLFYCSLRLRSKVSINWATVTMSPGHAPSKSSRGIIYSMPFPGVDILMSRV